MSLRSSRRTQYRVDRTIAMANRMVQEGINQHIPDERTVNVHDSNDDDISESSDEEMQFNPYNNPVFFAPQSYLHKDSYTEENASDDFDLSDIAAIDILLLIQDAGAPLYLYDKLLSIWRKYQAQGFDITNAPRRITFLQKIKEKVVIPKPLKGSINDIDFPIFPFLDQLQDLLSSSIFKQKNNILVNEESHKRFLEYEPTQQQKYNEILGSQWYHDTYTMKIDDPNKQFLVPLIFYTDKTGTDMYQRFPLEPLMFSTAILSNKARESAEAWRHLSFIPTDIKCTNPEESLQQYHNFLSKVLEQLKYLQLNPPIMRLNLLGEEKVMEVIMSVAFVMGDQLAQDQHCCRKAINSGGAGRIH